MKKKIINIFPYLQNGRNKNKYNKNLINKINNLAELNKKAIIKGKLFSLINKNIIMSQENIDSLKRDKSYEELIFNDKKEKKIKNNSFIINKSPNLIKPPQMTERYEDRAIDSNDFIANNFSQDEIDVIKYNPIFFRIEENKILKKYFKFDKSLLEKLNNEDKNTNLNKSNYLIENKSNKNYNKIFIPKLKFKNKNNNNNNKIYNLNFSSRNIFSKKSNIKNISTSLLSTQIEKINHKTKHKNKSLILSNKNNNFSKEKLNNIKQYNYKKINLNSNNKINDNNIINKKINNKNKFIKLGENLENKLKTYMKRRKNYYNEKIMKIQYKTNYFKKLEKENLKSINNESKSKEKIFVKKITKQLINNYIKLDNKLILNS